MLFKCLTIQESQRKLDEKFFRYNPHTGRSENFVNAREVAKSFSLPAGSYSVIPSTYSPGSRGEFYLRVFTETSGAGTESESGLRARSTENMIGSEEEERNTAVIKDEDTTVLEEEERNTAVIKDEDTTVLEDEEKNTAVFEEEFVPPQKDKTKGRRGNVGRKGGKGGENQIFRIKTDYTEITISLVERQK